MSGLDRKAAIVTGASRGIGLAIVKALIREGMRVGTLSRTKPGEDCEFVPCDLADSRSIPGALKKLLRRLGSVDFLVNNAGTFLEKPIVEMRAADWEVVQRVNLTAPFLIVREVLPRMMERRHGRIINIASTASTQAYLNQSAYVASKHGLLGFARALAMEARPHNVHVHTLCPGGVDTDLIKGTDLGERLKGKPMIQPRDIAEMVVFLLGLPENVDVPEVVVRRFDPKGAA